MTDRAQGSPGSLSWLIHPIDEATFFREYWERQPLVVARDEAGYLDGLLSVAEVDDLVGTGRLAYPMVRLIREGVELPPAAFEAEFQNTSGSERLADPGTIADHFRAGGTISLNQVHRVVAAVSDLCATLEADLSHTVETNLYLTPPNARGAPSHYDVVDVFILQVEGRKTWRLYEDPPIDLPLGKQRAQRGSDPGRTSRLRFETELRRGDVLYIPRGHVHEARTTDETSLHLTVVVDVLRYVDLVRLVLEDAARSDSGLRRALPAGFLGPRADLDAMREVVAALVSTLGERSALASALEHVRVKRRAAPRFLHGGRLLQADAANRVNEATLVARRSGLWLETEVSDPTMRVHFGGRSLELPSFAEDLIRVTRSGVPFRVRDLPPTLDPATSLAFVRTLVREGVLVILPAG